MNEQDAKKTITAMATAARGAMVSLSQSSVSARNAALLLAAQEIRNAEADIIRANGADIAAAVAQNAAAAFIDRLTLTPERIDSMATGLEAIAVLPDPLGRVLDNWQRPNGLNISRISTALGVLGVIYESRPNVTVDAAALAIKSGNAIILRGGSSSFHSSKLLAAILVSALAESGLSGDAVQFVDNLDRTLVGAMLGASGLIDVIIPRGGKSLVERVQRDARVPVFAHLEGICHLYIDGAADLEKAKAIAVNSKMRRVGICGAVETILIDRKIMDAALPLIADALTAAGCSLRLDADLLGLFPEADPAAEADWHTEYLAPIVSICGVDGVLGGMDHIRRYGSGHTESIITEDNAAADIFTSGVDSAIVMVNASTQFADGGEFGMGGEIGIATGRLHARGPVGANQLTSFKYVVRGQGQVRP